MTGLVNGTTYYFRVTAVNRVGQGPASAEVKAVPVTVPGAPVGLTATRGDGNVTLSWTAPPSNGGSPVSGYNIYVATSADFKGAFKVPGGTGTAVTVTGLVNGIPYYFRVTAVNRVGEGPASAGAKAVPATVPGAPVRLTATPGKSKVTARERRRAARADRGRRRGHALVTTASTVVSRTAAMPRDATSEPSTASRTVT